MRTTLALSEHLLRSAKRQASESGITLGEFLEDALRFHLARKPSASAGPFQLHTVAGRLVDPALNLDRTSALDTLDDELKFAGLPTRPRNK